MSDDEIYLDILRLQAKYFALETLCIALVNSATNKADVLSRFRAHKMALEGKVLHDAEAHDDVLHEILQAHEAIEGLITTSRSQP